MVSAIESLATGNSLDRRPTETQPRYQPLVIVAVVLAAGIVLDRYGWRADRVGFVAWWSAASSLLAAWWCAWRGGYVLTSAWLLLSAVALTGSAWHELRWNFFPRVDAGRYASFDAVPACATATVLAAPEILPAPRPTPLRAIPAGERSRAEVRLTAIRDGTDWRPADGRCQLLVDGHLLGVRSGDDVQIFGQLGRPLPPMNPGAFDFAAYARAERRLASLVANSPDCVSILQPNDGLSLGQLLHDIRTSGKNLLRTYLGPRHAGLAAAVLLGAREDLPTEEIEPFFLTGTIHLLVVSGLNVAILATGLYALTWIGWLPRRVVLATIVVVVVAYTLVAGAEPPVLRAAVLVVLVCLATWTGRRGVAFNSLSAAALVVLAINPAELFQTGTQLSFLCVAVLIWIGHMEWNRRQFQDDALDRLISQSRPWYVKLATSSWRWYVLLTITTTAVWFATLPLVLYRFHIVSSVTLLISPAVWLLALVAMWAGFMTLACGWLMPIVAVITGAICSAALTGLVHVVEWSETVPGSHFWAPGPALWWVLGFYAGLAAVMLWGNSLLSARWQTALVCGWVLVGLVPPLARNWTRGDELRCTFVAMGHGTCVVLETPDGRTLLYDAGSLGSPEFATQSVAGYLWHRGILRIDGLILSHADVDHYNAVPGLVERFRVGAVYVSPVMFDEYGATGPSEAPNVLRRAIDDAKIPIREIWAGDRLRLGREVDVEVIHPPQDGVIGSDNANSITVAVEYAGRRLLMPGDLETPGLDDVVAELPVDCDVLMAPHHGSRRSDPPGFAAWSTPEWVVISGGADADPEVRQTYRSAGAQVLNTGQLGAVQLRLSRHRIQTTTWLDRRHYQSR